MKRKKKNRKLPTKATKRRTIKKSRTRRRKKNPNIQRDELSGQYDYGMEKLCQCAHSLGEHGVGGKFRGKKISRGCLECDCKDFKIAKKAKRRRRKKS